MLYEGAIRFLQQAKSAIEQGNINERYNRLLQASEVVMGLQSCLDFEAGGDAARVLYDFYSAVDMRIMGLHRSSDGEACERVIQDLKDMRDVWEHIDRSEIQTVQSMMPPAAQPDSQSVAVGAVTVSV